MESDASDITIRPPNSLVLVVTTENPEIPSSMGRELVASTATCVAVGTLSELDGETTIRLTNATPADAKHGLQLVFHGTIDCPNGFVRVASAHHETYLERACAVDSLDVRIWANDSSEPDLIVVQVAGSNGG